jgi:peptidyl-prolyl cis-trans isomerase SurA
MRRGRPEVFAAVAIVVALSAAGIGRAEVVDRIIATVDGEPITSHEVQRYREASRSGENQLSEQQALEALITDKLLEREVRDKAIEIKPEEIDKYVDQVKQRNRIDDYRFEAALEAQGLTLKKYRERIKGELEKSQLVNREVRGRVSVSPAEIERYYEANREEFRANERVTVRDILFRVEPLDSEAEVERIRRKAEEVLALAVTGRDFAALAKQFSEGPGAERGGLLGTFPRGELDGPLDRAAFALPPGGVSEVIRGDRGFHILRVDKFEPAGYRALDEVREQVREVLAQKAVEQRFQEWISKDLRERHNVEVFN